MTCLVYVLGGLAWGYDIALCDPMRLVMNGLGFVHIQFCVPADYPARSIREVFEKKAPITIGTTPPEALRISVVRLR